MGNLYDEKFGNRYRYIVGSLVFIMIISLYFIFFNNNDSKALSEGDALEMINKMDENYEAIITNENYILDDKSYYIVHSNLKSHVDNKKINKNYSDEKNIDGKTYYKVDTSLYKSGGEGLWNARYLIDKETGVIYIEFKENLGKLINYEEYNKNVGYALSIIKKDDTKFPHIDVTIEDNIYTIHLYEVVINEDESHTATIGWYTLDTKTNKVRDTINEKDLN